MSRWATYTRFGWMTFVATPLFVAGWLSALLLLLSAGHWLLAGASIGTTWPIQIPTWIAVIVWIAGGGLARAIAANERDLQQRGTV